MADQLVVGEGPSRRAAILGAAGFAGAALVGELIAQDKLPGRVPAATLLGLGAVSSSVPDVVTGEVHRSSFVSQQWPDHQVNWIVALPPEQNVGGGAMPVCVVLHGRGDTAQSMLDLGYPQYLAAAVTNGVPPFALVSVDGADKYWHGHTDGSDAGAMVTEELLPTLLQNGLAAGVADRIAFLGWSMGGYGALLLGAKLGARRVAAIAAESPALWESAGEAAPGAFDGEGDFQRNNVYNLRSAYDGISLKVDCGQADPFLNNVKDFVSGLTTAPAGGFGRGAHTVAYWRSVAPGSLDLIGRALAG